MLSFALILTDALIYRSSFPISNNSSSEAQAMTAALIILIVIVAVYTNIRLLLKKYPSKFSQGCRAATQFLGRWKAMLKPESQRSIFLIFR